MLRMVLSLGAVAPYAIAALFCVLVLAVVALDVMIGVVGALTLPWDAAITTPSPSPAPAPPNPTPPTPPQDCVAMPGGLLICE